MLALFGALQVQRRKAIGIILQHSGFRCINGPDDIICDYDKEPWLLEASFDNDWQQNCYDIASEVIWNASEKVTYCVNLRVVDGRDGSKRWFLRSDEFKDDLDAWSMDVPPSPGRHVRNVMVCMGAKRIFALHDTWIQCYRWVLPEDPNESEEPRKLECIATIHQSSGNPNDNEEDVPLPTSA